MKNPLRSIVYPLLLTAALVPHASADLLVNGNFTGITNTVAGNTYTYGQFGSNAGPASGAVLTVNSWTTSGYNFVYTPGVVDRGTTAAGAQAGVAKEAPGQGTVNGYGNEYLWGSNNGGASTFGTNPFSGNFIAADGAYETGAITQQVTGLKTGNAYTLTFLLGGGAAGELHDGHHRAVAGQPGLAAVLDAGLQPAGQIVLGLDAASPSTTRPRPPRRRSRSWRWELPADSRPSLLLGGVTLVPEPSSGTLLGLVGAALSVVWFVRRRRLAVDAEV